MSIETLCDSVADILREGLRGECTVEFPWRLEAPRAMTLFVQPAAESGEQGFAIGNITADEGVEFDLIVEVPWDDREATMRRLIAVSDAAKRQVRLHRDLGDHFSGMHGRTLYRFVTRPGVAKPCFTATTRCRYQTIYDEED